MILLVVLLPWLISMAQADLDACADIDINRHGQGCNNLLQQLDCMIDRTLLHSGPAEL